MTGRYEHAGHYWDGNAWRPIGQPLPKQRKKWPIVVGAVVALLLIAGIIGAVTDDGKDTTQADSTRTTTAAAKTTTPEEFAEIQARQAAAATSSQQAAAASEAARVAAQQKADEARAAAAAAEAARLDPNTYENLGSRDYALLIKNPDANVGRKIHVYGAVIQLDAATGDTMFRAATGTAPGDRYDFDDDVVVNCTNPAIMNNLVEDDIFEIFATVGGSLTYDTQIGGSTTVPKFTCQMLNITG